MYRKNNFKLGYAVRRSGLVGLRQTGIGKGSKRFGYYELHSYASRLGDHNEGIWDAGLEHNDR